MANVLGKLFNDIANSIRNKTGNTETIKPIDFPAQIDSITGGGVEGCVIVTFMNGDEVLLTRPVYIGDDCPNPLTQGRIDTPTKESTVDTVYTYSGWSLTDGGSADTNSLSNVTEDRTVYAAYTESVRYYTVNFYDGETLRNTEQIPYGGSSTYTYAKDNYLFTGWTPEPTNVTSDMDCYGTWEESYSFADASWEYIAQMSESGQASRAFKVGDTKKETITFNGQTVTLTFAIADFNYDYLADGSGNTAGISIVQYYSNENCRANADESNDWTEKMKADFDSAYESGLPESLKAVIKQVEKKAVDRYNTIFTTNCYLWPLSLGELFTTCGPNILEERAQNRPYAIFALKEGQTYPDNIRLGGQNYVLRTKSGSWDYKVIMPSAPNGSNGVNSFSGELVTRIGFCI